MTDPLAVVDTFLGVPNGTTYQTIALHQTDRIALLNHKLRGCGIIIEHDTSIRDISRKRWATLMQQLGVGREWWMIGYVSKTKPRRVSKVI